MRLGNRRGDGPNRLSGIIATRLMEERLLAGVSRSRLAAVLGVSPEALQEYETGKISVPAPLLVNAVRILRIPLSRLVYENHCACRNDNTAGGIRWVGVSRPPGILDELPFRRVQHVLRVWRGTRGELTVDAHEALEIAALRPRSYLLRRLEQTTRLIFESAPYGVNFMLPCEGLLLIGREMHDLFDGEYGAWVEGAYDEALWSKELRIEAARALIRTARGPALLTRYDRVLIPWRRGSDEFIMGISLEREPPVEVRDDASLEDLL